MKTCGHYKRFSICASLYRVHRETVVCALTRRRITMRIVRARQKAQRKHRENPADWKDGT